MGNFSGLIDAIMSMGMEPPTHINADGRIHRFTSNKSKGKGDAWYKAFDDDTGTNAVFGTWRTREWHKWSDGRISRLSAEEMEEIDRQRKEAAKDLERDGLAAAKRADAIYNAADADVNGSDYLRRKKIKAPDGVRSVRGMRATDAGYKGDHTINGLIVPIRGNDGKLRSLQIITDNGRKLFLPGGRTGGGFHVLGDLHGADTILIAEGLSTAQSCVESTGLPCVVAFSAGNLPPVAKSIRAMAHHARIIITADNDKAGIDFAEQAAKKCGGRYVLPADGFNDFNDQYADQGGKGIAEMVAPAPSDDWQNDLIVAIKADGQVSRPCRMHNLLLILANADQFKGRISYDSFAEQPSIDGHIIDDVGPLHIMADIEKHWIDEAVNTALVEKAVQAVARGHAFHPVVDWLNGLCWDGVDRINSFFSDHFGTPHDDYYIAVARSLFISAVRRVIHPGCKVDTMIILEGRQGAGKTEAWKALFDPWYAEVIDSLNDKDFFSGQRGIWCADFGELDQFSRSETTRIKQVLTMREDNYRAHYGRTHQKHPRQLIFVGGTNNDNWLTDPTGGRRFLPVHVQDIDVDAIRRGKDQLWAEAMEIALNPGEWWLIPGAEEHQNASYIGDVWDDVVDGYLIGRNEARLSDILTNALIIEAGRQTKADTIRVGSIMRKLGWKVSRSRRGGSRQRVYVRE